MGGVSKYESYEASTYPYSIIASAASVVFVFVSFVSPHWLMNIEEFGESPFLNIGLWEVCFNEFSDLTHRYDRVYDGCYWTLAEELHVIDDLSRRPFFVAVQTFMTFVFILSLLTLCFTVVLASCAEEFEKGLLKLSFVVHFLSFGLGMIAVLIFAVLGDGREWMPHWEHNYLHWGFAFAVIGVLLQFVAGILFWIQYRIVKRGEGFSNTHGMFSDSTV